MAQIRQFQLQADRAKRLAGQVTDNDVRQRLLETADEYTRYAALFEARTEGSQSQQEPSHADA